jgi:CBS domain-containing protein
MMTPEVVAVDASQPVSTVEELMSADRIRHLPVLDGDVLVGLVSQRDVLAVSLPIGSDEAEDRERKSRISVQQIMRGSVETVGPDTDVVDAADRMLELKIGCLPVVDERLHLVGIVTEADFVRLGRELARSTPAPGARAPRARARRTG